MYPITVYHSLGYKFGVSSGLNMAWVLAQNRWRPVARLAFGRSHISVSPKECSDVKF